MTRTSYFRWGSVAGVLCVFALFSIYYVALELGDPVSVDPKEVVAEGGKFLWGSASLMLNLSMLWSAVISIMAVERFYSDLTKRSQHLTLAAGGVILLIVGLGLVYAPLAGGASNALIGPLNEHVKSIDFVTGANNILGVATTLLFAFASYFVTSGGSESSPELLAERMRWFRLCMYSGGALLAAAIYQVYRLYQWGASVKYPPVLNQAAPEGAVTELQLAQGLASSIAVASGVVFTGLMFVIFVPPAILLNNRLSALLAKAVKEEPKLDKEKWSASRELDSAPLTSVGSYLAVFSPLLTGFLTKVVELQ